MNRPSNPPTDDPRPTDPVFLFCILLAARRARDRMLEELARGWLREAGIVVVFIDELDNREEYA